MQITGCVYLQELKKWANVEPDMLDVKQEGTMSFFKNEGHIEKAVEVFPSGSESMHRDVNKVRHQLSAPYCSCSAAGNASDHVQYSELHC